jgi:hypothetical protein
LLIAATFFDIPRRSRHRSDCDGSLASPSIVEVWRVRLYDREILFCKRNIAPTTICALSKAAEDAAGAHVAGTTSRNILLHFTISCPSLKRRRS